MIRIVALTDAGLLLAKRIHNGLNSTASEAEIWFKPKPFAETVQQAFQRGERLIFICATGIVVRTLATVIESKLTDPPVLVLDEGGKFVIPLLSGHEGGANQWAAEVAALLQAQLVLTTANAYLAPVYTVGMGCERHCPEPVLNELLQQCLQQANLVLEDINSIHSIDIKADEVGLINLAKTHNKPYRTWSAAQLAPMEPLLSTRSDYVFNTVGVYGVAESAALLGAQQATGQLSELAVNKIKNAQATCAIARSYSQSHNQAHSNPLEQQDQQSK